MDDNASMEQIYREFSKGGPPPVNSNQQTIAQQQEAQRQQQIAQQQEAQRQQQIAAQQQEAQRQQQIAQQQEAQRQQQIAQQQEAQRQQQIAQQQEAQRQQQIAQQQEAQRQQQIAQQQEAQRQQQIAAQQQEAQRQQQIAQQQEAQRQQQIAQQQIQQPHTQSSAKKDVPKKTAAPTAKKQSALYTGKNYVQIEAEYGLGLGITGLGRMVNFNKETGNYTLRLNEKSSPRMPLYSANKNKDVDAENDEFKYTRVRIPAPLLEAVSDYWHREAGLGSNMMIQATDLFVFLLYLQLPSQAVRDMLKPLFIEQYKAFGPMLKAHELNQGDVNDVANSLAMQAVMDKLDVLENKTSTVLNGIHKVQEANMENELYTHSAERGIAFLLAYQFGWFTNEFPRDAKDAEGILNQDDIVRALRAMQYAGEDEVKRRDTIKNDMRRKAQE